MSIADDNTRPTLQHELLSRLPDYTEVFLLVPDNRLESIQRWLVDQPYGQCTTLIPYDPQHRRGARLYLVFPDEESLVAVDTKKGFCLGSQHGTQWAQDLFEVATEKNSRSVLLASCVHKSYQSLHNRVDRTVVSDNAYLKCLESDTTALHKLDLAFKGGNVLFDTLDGKHLAFCGYDSLRSTRIVREAFCGERLSDCEIAELFKSGLNVDQLVVVGGPAPQPELMYHLDQAMLLLPDHRAAVPRIIGKVPPLEPDASRIRQVQAFLETIRGILSDLGYALIDIDTRVQNLLHYQHYVNAIPYVDDHTGERVLLFPIFPSGAATQDEMFVARNIARLEATGYRIVKVPTHACELTGGIHCLLNVVN